MFSFRLENASGNIVNINDGIRYVVIPPVDGLSPPSASLFTSKSPNRKGSKYNGSTLDERNLIITVKILGDVEVNRNFLYSWIDTEQYCKVHYKNGVKSVYCEGYVQECPIDFFTDNEVVSLSIVCPNPYWKELLTISTDISNITKQFTFPFAIEHAEDIPAVSKNIYFDESGGEYYEENTTVVMEKGVPISTIRETNATSIVNGGAETGFQITIRCTGNVENLVIYDAKDTTKLFRLNATLEAGTMVVIDTEASPKTCKLYRNDGSEENIIKKVGANPTWFTLKKGVNSFGFTADNDSYRFADITISFSNKYAGV